MTITREEAKAAFQTTKAFCEGTIQWIEAANIVDAYLMPADEDEPDYRKHLVISCNRMCGLVEQNAPEFMLIAELELINTRALRLIKNEIFARAANRKAALDDERKWAGYLRCCALSGEIPTDRKQFDTIEEAFTRD